MIFWTGYQSSCPGWKPGDKYSRDAPGLLLKCEMLCCAIERDWQPAPLGGLLPPTAGLGIVQPCCWLYRAAQRLVPKASGRPRGTSWLPPGVTAKGDLWICTPSYLRTSWKACCTYLSACVGNSMGGTVLRSFSSVGELGKGRLWNVPPSSLTGELYI